MTRAAGVRAADVIARKRDGGEIPGDQLREFVLAYHPEPYLYVTPWSAQVTGELWNATGFSGAELSYADLLAAEDQRRTALDFFDARYRALQEG